ncbi:MAG TPA: RNA polymerase sigma factor [Acidimicrobiales bacterium]|nr:RNA polymerase sigma factor [Acidimicrobiales bacterium]
MDQDAEAGLRALYGTHLSAIYSYFARRVTPTEVDGLVSEVFVVAWRRFEDLPPTAHERKLYLYGIARRVLSDNVRSRTRRDRLHLKVTLQTSPAHASVSHQEEPSSTWAKGADAPDSDPDDPLIRALKSLKPDDQEVLRLHAWEQLTNDEAAEVLGCTANAFAIRLTRARQRLASVYTTASGGSDA